MRRRRFMVLGAVLLAGCSGDGGDDPESAPSGPTEEYSPTITFDSCSSVTVESERPYSAVGISLPGEPTEMFEEGYEGTNTFEVDGTATYAVVWAEGDGKAGKNNPDVDGCSTPE